MKTKNMIVGKITFPPFSGARCLMMPYIQGDSSTLPPAYHGYSSIIDGHYIEKGKVGFLTIDESFVASGKSQRGYNSMGISRNVHIEVGRSTDGNRWGGSGGGSSWGGKQSTLLDDDTMVLIANSISNTCRVWDAKEMSPTPDGDLSKYIDRYPEDTGMLLKAGELALISIFTPHEAITQPSASNRQFLRIVGSGVRGREPHFTKNPLMETKQFITV